MKKISEIIPPNPSFQYARIRPVNLAQIHLTEYFWDFIEKYLTNGYK